MWGLVLRFGSGGRDEITFVEGRLGVDEFVTFTLDGLRVDVRILDIDATHGVDETLHTHARPVGSGQHVPRESDGLSVVALAC